MNRPVPATALRSPSPVLAKPDLVFQWERFSAVSRDLAPAFLRHWREVAIFQNEVPYDPDWERMFALDRAGVLHILTARAGGVLVGYVVNLVSPNLHHLSTVWAHVEAFWLDPVHRRGWNGVKLFTENAKGLKVLGARIVTLATLPWVEAERGTVSRIVKRLGYAPMGEIWGKLL